MRVVVFGVDGLTWHVLRPLIQRGDLPHFARLQREGVEAGFISTVPALTPPAWMSLVTGLKPAKHGVFDFWDFDVSTPGARPTLVTHRKGGKAIWNILSEYGKRVIVMNVPLTFPAEAVNGVMVSGLMTPGTRNGLGPTPFVFPGAFRDELSRVIPNYQIDLSLSETSPGYVTSVLEMTEKRIQLQEHLLSEHEWDFALLAYVGPDRIQHAVWDDIVSLRHEATSYYRMLDDALGLVLNRLTPDDVLFVASDHGFVGAKDWFYINEHLRRRKLLVYGSDMGTARARLVGYGREAALRLGMLNIARQARRAYGQFAGKRTDMTSEPDYHPSMKGVDWESTRGSVPFPTAMKSGYADIYLAPGTTAEEMEEMRQTLAEERHPETGAPLCDAIYATDAFGTGPFRPQTEHIILEARPGTSFHLRIGRPELWETLAQNTGVHEKEGVFYAWGAGMRRGERVEPLQIYDLVPTALHAFGISADQEFDGRIARQVFAANEPPDEPAHEESLVARKLNRLRSGQAPVH